MTTETSGTRIVKTICNLCMNHCGIDVHVRAGKVVKVKGMAEHPFHRLCVKAAAYPALIHSDQRLRHPLAKDNGTFRRITWDEAFGRIAERLSSIKAAHGARAVVIQAGNGQAVRSTPRVIRRFAEAFGTPNFITGGWTCFAARVMAFKLTMGSFPNPDYAAENRCMIVWGKDPVKSSAPERHQINLSQKRGARLIVVDPMATGLARRADIHAQLRPGTDCALALGMLNVVIAEGLYAGDFVKNWTVGFDQLADHVRHYPPEMVEKMTWVPAAVIRDMARMYARNRPASISVGVSLDHSSNGIQTMRAIAALMAICGNLEIAGGNLTYPGLPLKNLNLPERIESAATIGDDFPLFSQLQRQPSGTRLTDIILTQAPYPVKALLIAAANPLVNWPNSNRVRAAFERLDFLVAADLFMTDTARMADIVLPAASDLETEDIRSAYFNHNCLPLVVKTNRAIAPIGESMEDWKIWTELGRRMGYGEFFPWQTSDDLLRDLLSPSKITLEALNDHPGGIHYCEKKPEYYLDGGFKTPSKKVELYSETLAGFGYDPLPTFHEPVESPVSRPDLARTYPFIFVAGTRASGYTHSRFRELARLRKLCPTPQVEMNPCTAAALDITDGETVCIDSPRGRIRAAVSLRDGVAPDVLVLISGWSNATGANANCLTNDAARDPVSGYPEFRTLLCNVTKIESLTDEAKGGRL